MLPFCQVHDATAVGDIMRSFATAQKCLSSDRKTTLEATVKAMLGAVQGFVKTYGGAGWQLRAV